DQSSEHLNYLITSFLRGQLRRIEPEPPARPEMAKRLHSEIVPHNTVPTFLEHYLLEVAEHDVWTPRATAIASRYLRRRSSERFVAWSRRQQLISELNSEPVRGTELGFRQMLYSQGVDTAFRWRGVPCFKTSCDIAIYAMLLYELHPRTIIELGSGEGGSAL